MKKLLKLSFMFALGSLTLASCSKDEEEEPTPVINVTTPAGGNTTAAPGSSVEFAVTMSANNELRTLGMTYSLNGSAPTIVDLTPFDNETTDSTLANNTTSFVFEGSFQMIGSAGDVETLTFTVTDKKGLKSSASLNVTIASGIETRNVVLLGNQNASSGSYYNAIADQVLMTTAANSSQASVDFMFFTGASNLETIASMDSQEAGQFGSVASWTTRNETRFSTTSLSASEFDAIDSEAALIANGSGASGTLANMLSVGDVVAFQLDAQRGGNYGMFKVSSISGNEITLAIKIQE